MSNPSTVIATGSFMAFLAVALGAFGAHGLKHHITAAELDIYHIAVQYHMMHSLGLLLIGALMQITATRRHALAASFMLLGIMLFCGSLYVLSISGMRWLGMVTPFGGMCFLIAWLLLCSAYLFPAGD